MQNQTQDCIRLLGKYTLILFQFKIHFKRNQFNLYGS